MSSYLVIIFITGIVSVIFFRLDKVRTLPRKTKIILALIFLVSIIVRVYKYDSAMGLNVDEAMGGYNSWSIAHYGVDSELKKLPIYFYAWGPGMNALYLYLAVPFVKILGLSIASYRLPIVLCSILSMFYLCYTFLTINVNIKLLLLSISIIYLSPWTIQLNRFAVESDIFPVILVTIISTLLLYLNKDKSSKNASFNFAIFSILLGISAYAYSSEWFFLPIFLISIYAWLLLKNKLTYINLGISLLIILSIVWPLMIFIYINYFGGHEMQILGMTITKLSESRSSSQLVIGQGNIVRAIWNNLKQGLIMLYSGTDNLYWNTLPTIGAFYPFMLFFGIIGLVSTKIGNKNLNVIMLITLLAEVPLALIVIPNYTHFMGLQIPILYFESLGVYAIISFSQKYQYTFVILFSIALLSFCHSYFVTYKQSLASHDIIMSTELNSVFKLAKKSQKEVYYVGDSANAAFTVMNFYHPVSPYTFNRIRGGKLKTTDGFVYYTRYRNIHFLASLPSKKKNVMYILQNSYNIAVPKGYYYSHNYGLYTVYEYN